MWKRDQKQKKVKSKISLAVYALATLIGLLLLAKLITVITSFNQPFNSDLSNSKPFDWDGKSSINLVFLTTSLSTDPNTFKNTARATIVNLSPADKKIAILHLSDQIYAQVPKNYGNWQLGSVYQLGQEEKPQVGAKLVKLTLTQMLGLPIDGIVITNSSSKIEDMISSWHKSPVTALSLLTQVKTDLTPKEMLDFIWTSSKIRPDKIDSLDLAQSTITESKLLPDSSRVLGVNTVKLDTFIREKLEDLSIDNESYTISVFNATKHPGLAQDAARIITNMGGNVVMVTNTEQLVQNSALLVASELKEQDPNSITVKKLTTFFAPRCFPKKNFAFFSKTTTDCSSQDPKVNNSRSQINIILGEDYYKLWSER